MYLKYMEIQGFKSFVNKTRLEFDAGITAIVGPNGCGKSNISDAIRWCLGEQSPKSLRGARMEDVIFGGTAARRAVGMAEVTLVLEGFGADFAELGITRRVLRSGESEYLINGAKCRLRDIHERFMDTGLGREGYSIISQGRIEEILSTKSEERRDFFEEATGIVKFKSRKEEAERKLANHREALVRVDDLIDSMQEQRGPLEVASEKARVFMRLTEERRGLKLRLFVDEVEKFGDERVRHMENIVNLEAEIAEKNSLAENLQMDVDTIKAAIAKDLSELDKLRENTADASLAAKNKENEIALCRQKLEHGRRDAEGRNAEIARLDADLKNSARDLAAAAQTLGQADADLARRREDLGAAAAKAEGLDADFARVSAALAQAGGQAAQFEGNRWRIDDEISRKTAEVESKQKDLGNIVRQMESDKNLVGLIMDADWMPNGGFAERLEELREYLTKIGKEIEGLKTRAAQGFARHEALAELAAGFEGYHGGVRAVFARKQAADGEFAGVFGTVASLIRVDAKYERAVEAALGGAAQHIIVDTEKSAQIAIEYLKTNRAGRATFLPISAVTGRIFDESDRAKMNAAGILGGAADFVRHESRFGGIVNNLLGRTIICDTLDNAIKFSKKYKYAYRLVTLEGDVINPAGSITGGSDGRGSRLLGREREIEDLAAQAAELADEIERAEIAQNQALAEEARLAQAAERLGAIGENTRRLEGERRDSEIAIDLAQKRLAELAEVTKSAAGGLDAAKAEQERLSADLAQITSARDGLAKITINLRVEIGTLEERHGNLCQNIARLEDVSKNGEKRILEIRQAEENLAKEITALNRDIERHEGELSKILENRKKLDSEILAIQNMRGDKTNDLTKAERDFADLTKNLAVLQGELIRLNAGRERLQENIQRLYDEIWEEYGLSLLQAQNQAAPGAANPEMRRREREIREEIRGLGAVNMAAIEDYAALSDRLDYLLAQRRDIREAEGKVLGIIAELRQLMSEQFTKEFAQISENFGKVFVDIFGGGQAYLKILENENILEAGIEIFASPPGKSLQNMSLLSGGERALCAIALLFAILWQRPSPFCVLDEIETALDEGNIKRFADYLARIKSRAQFILITHRKGTMEIADTLIGVTMEERGVSKPIGIKFNKSEGVT